MKYYDNTKTVRCGFKCNFCPIGIKSMDILNSHHSNPYAAALKIGIHVKYVNNCYTLGKHFNIPEGKPRKPKKGEYIKVRNCCDPDYEKVYYARCVGIKKSLRHTLICVDITNNENTFFYTYELLSESDLKILENLERVHGKSKNAYYTENGVNFTPVTNVTKA